MIQSTFRGYGRSIDAASRNALAAAGMFGQVVEGMVPSTFDVKMFNDYWPSPPKVYFQDAETGKELKGMQVDFLW